MYKTVLLNLFSFKIFFRNIFMSLINIAPLATVYFSSKSKYSTPNDKSDLVCCNPVSTYSQSVFKGYSFHSKREAQPYVIIDLHRPFKIMKLIIFNRLDCCQERAKSLIVQYSVDNHSFSNLFEVDYNWGKILSPSFSNVEARYLKFSLREIQFFHLKKIEVYTELLSFFSEHDMYELTVLTVINKIGSFLGNDFRLTAFVESKDYLPDYKFLFLNDDFPFLKYVFIKDDNNWKFYAEISSHGSVYLFNQIIDLLSDSFSILLLDHGLCRVFLCDNLKLFKMDFFSEFHAKYFNHINALSFLLLKSTTLTPAQKTLVVINSDMVHSQGFSDRFRGILSMIKICNDLNFDYTIKFTIPYDLSKYYNFKHELPNPNVFENFVSISLRPTCDNYKIYHGYDEQFIYGIFESILKTASSSYRHRVIELGTNHNFCYDCSTYSNNFSRTNYLEEEIQKYKDIIGSNYITVSFRFLNALGAKNERNHPTLDTDSQIFLMNKCKSELVSFINSNSFSAVLVLSDTPIFLHFIKDIDNVFVFPDNIAHIARISSDTPNGELSFLKMLVDFNLIVDADENYLFLCDNLYSSGFPRTAARCGGKVCHVHEF